MTDNPTSPGNIPSAYQRQGFPPPPPPPRRNGWRTLFIILFIFTALFLVVSLFANFLLFSAFVISGGPSEGTRNVTEDVIRRGGPERVAVLPASGTVDGAMLERLRKFIDCVHSDHAIKAVVLEVDSPGGTITASDEIFHLMENLHAGEHYPLVVSMRGLAASGGYYISMPAEKIYAEKTTITGSIGVIWPAFEASELLNKIGVKPEIITSDQAVFKDAASPFRKFTEADRAYIKTLVNDAHEKFSKVVEEGRKLKLKVPMTQVAVGRVWSADEALKLGLIDEIAYPDEVWTKTAAAAGISNPTVVRLREKTGLLEGLIGAGASGKTGITVDPKMIYELQVPRMEFRYVDPAALGGGDGG